MKCPDLPGADAPPGTIGAEASAGARPEGPRATASGAPDGAAALKVASATLGASSVKALDTQGLRKTKEKVSEDPKKGPLQADLMSFPGNCACDGRETLREPRYGRLYS